MNRVAYVAIGLAVATLIVAGSLYYNRGAHVVLRGEIKKVRVHGVDAAASVAVVDFRFVNPADYPFVVREVELTLIGPGGKETSGMVVSDLDARRFLEAVPELGPKYNDTLKTRDKIAPRSGDDRMVAARFEVPVAELESRQAFRVRVRDVDGPVSDLVETRR